MADIAHFGSSCLPRCGRNANASSPKVFCRSTTALETIHQRLDALDAADLSAFYGRLLVLTGFSWAVRTAELVLFTFTRDLIDSDIGMGTTALQTLGMGEFVGAAIEDRFSAIWRTTEAGVWLCCWLWHCRWQGWHCLP